jgi:hypothetical protein
MNQQLDSIIRLLRGELRQPANRLSSCSKCVRGSGRNVRSSDHPRRTRPALTPDPIPILASNVIAMAWSAAKWRRSSAVSILGGARTWGVEGGELGAVGWRPACWLALASRRSNELVNQGPRLLPHTHTSPTQV